MTVWLLTCVPHLPGPVIARSKEELIDRVHDALAERIDAYVRDLAVHLVNERAIAWNVAALYRIPAAVITLHQMLDAAAVADPELFAEMQRSLAEATKARLREKLR